MGSLFKKGYTAVREEKQRQDENREKMGKRLWRFFLAKDGDEAVIRFLTEEPINFYEHTIKNVRNGKESYDTVICTEEIGGCSLCDSGDKPSFKGAFLVYDKRPYEYKDKDGKTQKGKGQLRLYVQGARVLSQLDRLSERYGLTNRDYIISRTGSGTATNYMFDRTDEVGKLSKAEIENMLPEKLREMYDGTMESLYKIVQDQLEMSIKGDSSEDEDDFEDGGTAYEKASCSNLVGLDDEQEEAPRQRKPMRNMRKGGLKPKENSVKPLFRNKNK